MTSAEFNRIRREPLLDNASYDAMLTYLEQESIPALIQDVESGQVAAENMGHAFYDLGAKHLNVAILRYSGGSDLRDMVGPLDQAIEAFERNVDGDATAMEVVDLAVQNYFVEALWLLSLTTLLGRGRERIASVASLYAVDETNDGADELFESILAKLGRRHFEAEGTIHADPYQVLLDCINAKPEQRPGLMAQFLKRWFKGQKECDWWGSHIPRKGMTVLDTGFFGYWAFEAALVTYLWDIDDSTYRDLPHYPKDLVDFARQNALRPFDGQGPSRVMGGEACPRAGFWHTPASVGSRRRFSVGETMPKVGGSWGATIWQWDSQQ